MRFLISLFFSFIFLHNLAYAHEGEKKIRLMGKVQEDVSKRISVKALEKPFTLLEFKIYNPYEKRADLYKGILLDQLVQELGTGEVSAVTFKAIDDYEITIEKKSWLKHRIIISTQVNGAYIPIKKKGPIRIVYPDLKPDMQDYKELLSTWAWMITKIEFK